MALAPEPASTPGGIDPALPLDWLARASDLLQGAFESAPVGLFLADPEGGIRWCNGTWREQFDMWGPAPIALDLWLRRLDDDSRVAIATAVEQATQHGGSIDLSVSSPTSERSSPTRLRITAGPSDPNDARVGIVGSVIEDRTESSNPPPFSSDAESVGGEPDEWLHQAMHDPLTDLPNRLLLNEHLERALARCERDESQVALLFFDIDRFKGINDTQGHEAGDLLLRQLAERLTADLRPSDTVARLGGDEFVVLLDHVVDERDALNSGQRITDAIERAPFVLPDLDLDVTVSAGIALSRPGIEPSTLMREADTAMYRAKERGRARLEIYDEVLRRRTERRVDLSHRLHAAIESGAIDVHFQPCADLHSGKVVAVEALARWPQADGADREFLDVAIDSGLIVPLGQLVLEQACREAAHWSGVNAEAPPRVHVNLSARQLQTPGIVDDVAGALDAVDLDPALLCLEMPEASLTNDLDATKSVLAGLKGIGVLLAIDDFGTASSSLPYLRDLEINVIKIDGSFVAGLGTHAEDAAITAAIISITHSLGMEAVAEGVETVQQLAELQALGCDAAQGFLFSRPVPEREIVPFLNHVFAV